LEAGSPPVYVPRHRVSLPLHRPEERHSLTAEPTSMKPVSQVKMAVALKLVWVPIFLPLVGDGSSPHEMTAEGTQRPERCRDGPGNRVNVEHRVYMSLYVDTSRTYC
jgi:hypothetical protein